MSPPEQLTPEENAHAMEVFESIAVSLDRIATVMEARYIRDHRRKEESLLRDLDEAVIDSAERALSGPEDDEPTSSPPPAAS